MVEAIEEEEKRGDKTRAEEKEDDKERPSLFHLCRTHPRHTEGWWAQNTVNISPKDNSIS
jgi:hypothetical protein